MESFIVNIFQTGEEYRYQVQERRPSASVMRTRILESGTVPSREAAYDAVVEKLRRVGSYGDESPALYVVRPGTGTEEGPDY